MDKPFTVKEYDTIICNTDFEKNDNYKYLEKEKFDNLSEFILEFTGDDENADAMEFMRVSSKRPVGNCITIQNYVGLIQMKNGFQIQILPKISFSSEADGNSEKTKKIFLKMLRSMKDFPGKAFHSASLNVDKMNLYDLFINMYLQEVRTLVKHGLKSAYVSVEDNIPCFKGKLQVAQHIRNNLAHKERFYVAYDEFIPNRAENRIIKATLLKLQKITASAENKKEIRQLLTAFELVEASVHYEKDFTKIVINRNTKDYEMLMKWSKVFLLNKSFTTFSGKTVSRALLFPMESVFESYVAQQMRKVFCSDGWEISTQDKGQYLFMAPRKQFALRPDIVIKKDGRTIILDTKWKKLNNNSGANYGIKQADMYQMYAYSKKHKTEEIWLLYPVNDEVRDCKDICFDAGEEKLNTKVHVFFVDVAEIENSLTELKEKLEQE